MKKFLAVLLCIVIAVGLLGCGTKEEPKEEDPVVAQAIEAIYNYWADKYTQIPLPNDGRLEIVHTRKLTFQNHEGTKLEDIAYIVEFQLLTDYYGTAPYYVNIGMDSQVLFYKDGSTEIVSNYLLHYIAGKADFEFVQNHVITEDFGGQYNRVMNVSK